MLKKLTSWLWSEKPDKPQAAQRTRAPRAARSGSASPRDPVKAAFNEKLRSLCQSHHVISGGRLHVINLSGIKEKFGAKWEAISEKIAFVIKRSFEQRLSAQDFYYEVDENVFVVILAGLSPEQAALKCGVIAREITAKLFGSDEHLGAVEINSAAVGIDGNLLVEAVDPLALVVQELESAVPTRAASPAPRQPSFTPANPSVERDATLRSTELSSWVAVPAHPREDPPGQQIPVRTRPFAAPAEEIASLAESRLECDGARAARAEVQQRVREIAYQRQLYELMRLLGDAGKRIDDWRRFQPAASRVHFERDQARKGSGVASATQATGQRPASPSTSIEPEKRIWMERAAQQPSERPVHQLTLPGALAGAEITYQPVWYAGKNAITSYQAELRVLGEKGSASIDEVLSSANDPVLQPMVDVLLLRKAISDLARGLQEGKKSVISVPIHYGSIAEKQNRAQILEACLDAPDLMRRLLVLDITDLYMADWKHLPSLLQTLRKVCRALTLRISLDQPIREELAASGAHAVGGDLRDHNWNEEYTLRALNQFAASAQQAKLGTYIYGVATRSIVVASVCAGFDYVAGSAVVENVELPRGVFPFEPLNLYRSH